jgi:hypothetical protein
MLSPNSGNRPLPLLVPEHPTISTPPPPLPPVQAGASLYTSQTGTSTGKSPLDAVGRMSPSRLPPIRTTGIVEPERRTRENGSPFRPRFRQESPSTPRAPYPTIPTTGSILYPDPIATMVPLPLSAAGSSPRSSTSPHHRQTQSLDVRRPRSRSRSPSEPDRQNIRRIPSTSSAGSYRRFESDKYLDPAYLASGESLYVPKSPA